MADTRQTEPPPKRRQPSASRQDLLEDREETKKLMGEWMADSAQRTDRVLAAQTEQTDALHALAEPLTRLVGVLSERRDVIAPVAADAGEDGNGSAGEAIPTADRTDTCAADDVEEEADRKTENEREATAADEGTGDGDAADSDDEPEAGKEISETVVASSEAGQVDEMESQSATATAETPDRETEPSGTAAPNADALGDAGENAPDTRDRPAGEAEARSEADETTAADRREVDDTEAEASGATPGEAEIIAVLSAMRADMGSHANLVQLLHRAPPPAAGASPDTGTAEHAERRYHDLTGYLDKFVVALIEHVGGAEQSIAGNLPDRPPPTDVDKVAAAVSDLAKQLRAERRGLGPLAWIAAVAGVIALPAMLAAGIFLQMEFDVVPAADPSLGWKDRIWEEMGPELAGCFNLEDAGAGDCVVTVTPPAQ